MEAEDGVVDHALLVRRDVALVRDLRRHHLPDLPWCAVPCRAAPCPIKYSARARFKYPARAPTSQQQTNRTDADTPGVNKQTNDPTRPRTLDAQRASAGASGPRVCAVLQHAYIGGAVCAGLRRRRRHVVELVDELRSEPIRLTMARREGAIRAIDRQTGAAAHSVCACAEPRAVCAAVSACRRRRS